MKTRTVPIVLALLLLLAACGASYNTKGAVDKGEKPTSVVSTPSDISEDAKEKTVNIECANDYEAVATEKVVEGMIFSYVLEQDALETRLCLDYDGAEIMVSASNGDLIQKIETDLTVDSAGNYIGFIDFNRDSYIIKLEDKRVNVLQRRSTVSH